VTWSAAERRHYRDRGYLVAPSFFTPREIAAMRGELERLRAEGLLRNVATEGDGKTTSVRKRNLQLCPMYPHSRLFRALPFHPLVVDAVSGLLGDPIVLRLDQVFLKPAGDGSGTSWHQDNAYFKILNPLHGLAMWIAVHPATVENGTLRVIPFSFRDRYRHVRDPHSDHHIRCFPPEDLAVPVELPAGGVVFFSYGTAHCTGPNPTEEDRAGVTFHFVHARSAAQDAGYAADRVRGYQPFLTGPEATGGFAEYGERVAGTWEAEVAQLVGPDPSP
jgi:ectoine hydroxylase-related dioxygenase (phytanoyl-CoA dioxygenase family)